MPAVLCAIFPVLIKVVILVPSRRAIYQQSKKTNTQSTSVGAIETHE